MPQVSEARAIYDGAYSFIASFSQLTGFDVIRKDWHFSVKNFFSVLNEAAYVAAFVSTFRRNYGDIVQSCFALANTGYFFVEIHRFATWPFKKDAIHAVLRRYEAVIDTWDPESEEGRCVLANTRRFRLCLGIFCGYLITGGVLCMLPSLVLYVLSGPEATTLPFEYYLPGLNETSSPGFEINLTYQMFQTYFVNMFLLLLMTFANVLQCDILKIQLTRLGDLLAISRPETPPKDARDEENALLRGILRLHQDLDEYLDDTEVILSQQQFVDIFTFSFTIVMVSFILSNWFYPPGIPIAVLNTGMLFVVCAMGTVVQSRLEELHDSIYQICWYKLTLSNQRLLQVFMLKAQAAERLTAGGLQPLNLNLFVAIMNKIYSYIMVLREMSVEV